MTKPAMPKAMVLAAGLGTRMRPLTEHLPKPLIQVAGVPLIDRALDWLTAAGIEEAVVNSHHHAEKLEAHLAARQSPRILLSPETEVLETGGGIFHALPLLGDLFFVVNSDVICIDGPSPALHRLLAAWDDSAMDALLLVHPVEQAVGYHEQGDFFVENGHIRRRLDHPRAPFVFTGVQLMHRRLFRHAPGGKFSLNVLYNHGMQSNGTLPRIRALAHDGAWLHVGDPQGLREAEAWLAQH
ncbi:MAG: nucleotidyltransferase family protein [Pseudomonadota bacterium]|nr:nucleotidyltransferase family protein [Pseudomonadota bacterium]